MSSGIFLGLGSNLGDRLKNLRDAIALMECRAVRQSSVYETEPVGYTDQPWFLNMVLQIDTELNPQELLRRCQQVEMELKRKREIPQGPRTIDLDILFYHDVICHEPELILPHPTIPERRFVLKPMSEIAPDFVHPLLQKTIAKLLETCADNSVVNRFLSHPHL